MIARLIGGGLLGMSVIAAGTLGWGLRVDHLREGHKIRADRAEQHFADFRSEVVRAGTEAIRKNTWRIQRVEAEGKRNDERTINELEERLARTGNRLQRLRDDAKAGRGRFEGQPMSAQADATCEAYAGTDCDGLLAKLKVAEDQASMLVELRQWAADEAAIDVNAEAGP